MIVGILVGGRSTRMGGRPKGLLTAPDSGEALVVRTARIIRQAGHVPLLVGSADAYRAALPDVARVADEPADVGPLGGLNALLRTAGAAPVIALACDMPFVSDALLTKLAAYPSTAPVLAARNDEGKWEPLCARYDAERVRPVLEHALSAGMRSFRALFGRLAVEVWALSEVERAALCDWDTPQDVARR